MTPTTRIGTATMLGLLAYTAFLAPSGPLSNAGLPGTVALGTAAIYGWILHEQNGSKKDMKKTILAVLRYAIAIACACVFAGFSSSPFLKPGDFSVPTQMIFVAAMSGFYIVAFIPIVIVTEVLARTRSDHHILPLWAIPIFGLCFPVLGFVLFSRKWWPEEPADMGIRHILTFMLLAAVSIGIATVVMCTRNKSKANKADTPN